MSYNKHFENYTSLKRLFALMLTIGVSSFVTPNSFAAEIPRLRGMTMDPVSINEDSYSEFVNSSKTGTTKTTNKKYDKAASLNAGTSELLGIVGKTQLIKFDEPVKRISIANPDLADLVLLSPQELLLNGKNAGATSLIIWGTRDNPVFFDLIVKTDSTAFLNALNKIAPNEDFDLEFNDSKVVVTGKISSSILKEKIKELSKAYGFEMVDLAESPTQQILLEVKVIESSKAFQKYFSTTMSKGDLAANYPEIGGIKTPDLAKKLSFIDFDGTLNGFRIFRYNPGSDTAFNLKLAEQKGLIKILAEPKIMAANLKDASFNAGQEVPIPSGFSETGQVAYEYKKIGVNVNFKPTIMEESRRILLEIKPEVSEIDSTATIQQSDGSTAYGFKTRSMDTTVELADGQTLIIGGLYKISNQDTKTQIPFLGNIPVIGHLFKNSTLLKDETELMIFVTPKIVDSNKGIDRI